jgi:hypothetical protein
MFPTCRIYITDETLGWEERGKKYDWFCNKIIQLNTKKNKPGYKPGKFGEWWDPMPSGTHKEAQQLEIQGGPYGFGQILLWVVLGVAKII